MPYCNYMGKKLKPLCTYELLLYHLSLLIFLLVSCFVVSDKCLYLRKRGNWVWLIYVVSIFIKLLKQVLAIFITLNAIDSRVPLWKEESKQFYIKKIEINCNSVIWADYALEHVPRSSCLQVQLHRACCRHLHLRALFWGPKYFAT